MARRRRAEKRPRIRDSRCDSELVTRLVNFVMSDGNDSINRMLSQLENYESAIRPIRS